MNQDQDNILMRYTAFRKLTTFILNKMSFRSTSNQINHVVFNQIKCDTFFPFFHLHIELKIRRFLSHHYHPQTIAIQPDQLKTIFQMYKALTQSANKCLTVSMLLKQKI